MTGKRSALCFLFVFITLLSSYPSCRAGNPDGAYYHWSGSRLFWFMIISDTHIGASGSQDDDFLEWSVTEAREIINPLFIVNSGDLTDSTNGGTIPNGPYQEEWDAYRQILDNAGMDATFYYDIPGNHEGYNDADLSYYIDNSIQGEATGATQHSWMRVFPYGSYHFLGLCTPGNDGASFSIWPWDNFGDNAGLDATELTFIETELANHPDADLTLIFGHHPFDAGYFSWKDTGLTYGRNNLLNLIDTYGVSSYEFGHTHHYRENFYYNGLTDGVFYLNVDSLGKSDEDPSEENHLSIMAVDGNALSVIPVQKGTWPMVLITAPVDHNLGDTPQPFVYEIPQGQANPVRALVFDNIPVISVQFRIDDDSTWQDMQKSADRPLWSGFWDTTSFAPGPHAIEVRAQGSSTVVDHIDTVVNPALCMGDADRDSDVDGADIAAFASDLVPEVLQDFAVNFGSTACP